MQSTPESQEQLKEYYGRILKSSKDLKTKACCCDGEPLSAGMKNILRTISPEILNRSYGCGSPIPDCLEGCTVLDLGCGAGRDAFLLSRLVGEGGRVIGVDMTEEQLAVARSHVAGQMQAFGYAKANVEFRQGYMEDLAALGIADNSVDVVVSNCVINLSPDKRAVFAEIFRVLKPGGELHFADIFAGRRVPAHFENDPVLHGECLAGALYIEDFRRLLRELGCPDYRLMVKRKVALDNPAVEDKVGMVDFYSMTVRAFKLACLEDICEDYGQSAVYLGTVPGHPHAWDLDAHHRLITGKPMLVCGNTAAMLEETRFGRHFRISGDRSTHFGPFDCSPPAPEGGGSACGC
ncbi:methyltransferase domain-containing protein [Thiovibrio sp. JS02]